MGSVSLGGRQASPREQAKALKHKLHADAGRPPDVDITYAAYIRDWYLPHARATVRVNTVADYESTLNAHVLGVFGPLKVAAITSATIDRLMTNMTEAGCSVYVRAKTYRIVRATLRHALKPFRIITHAPTDDMDPVRQPTRHELDTYSAAESRAVLAAFAGHRYEKAVQLALTVGMRRSEICALDKQTPNFAQGTIPIRRGLHATKGGLRFEAPKSPRSRRVVRPPAFVMEDWPRGFGPLFPSSRIAGGYTRPETIRKECERVIREAGVRFIPFRDWRHSAATLMLTGIPELGIPGLSMEEVRDILGHEDLSTTEEFYDNTKRSASVPGAEMMQALHRGLSVPAPGRVRKRGPKA